MFAGMAVIFSTLIPRKFLEKVIKPALVYAGSKDDVRQWAGIRVLASVLAGAISFLIPFSLFPLFNFLFNTNFYFEYPLNIIIMLGMGAGGFAGAVAIFYLHITYVIDGRKKMVENILPDFLFLVGNNLKSGMAPFYAFRSAVRPEFGPLSEEIKIATQKSLGLDSFSEALRSIGKRIDSKVLSDTTKFFAQAMRSGGHLAQLIETTAADIKQTNKLKKELITSTKMYTLFILFVVVVASPMLLAVSVEFLTILSGVQEKTQGLTPTDTSSAAIAGQVGFNASAITISPGFMQNIGYFLIVINSLLASVFIGVLGGGKIQEGIKFAPLMIIVGMILFVIFTNAIGGLVGGLG